MREIDIESKVVAWAKTHDITVLKLNIMGNTGWPDRVFLHLGRLVFIEFKRPGEDLKRNQPARIEDLVSQGFTIGVFDNVDNSTRLLEATLLSERWRNSLYQTGVCWIALQARAWKNVSYLHGISYSPGQRVR
jgi:hypothetical protein